MQKTFICFLKRNTLSLFFTLFAFSALSITNKVTAQSLQQKLVSFNFQSVLLQDALGKIETLSGYNLVYNKQILPANKKINLALSNQSVEIALNKLLGNDYQFSQIDNNIVITKNDNSKYGTITGTILDEGNDILVGANVWVKELKKGVSTDLNGSFEITKIPPGTYTLITSYIGYVTQTTQKVIVRDGETTRQTIKLAASSTELSEVVVKGAIDVKTAEIKRTNEVQLINEIKSSDLIVTGISNVQITRSLDFNAAEVIQRAPGISIINKFINVRGLYERYNMVYINSMIAPSSESDKRAFSFDLLPSGVIDKIIIHRNAAPELPGDFAGGLVKIHTKEAVPARQLQVKFATQYREGSNLTNTYTYNGSKTDWLGFDDGKRKLPSGIPARGEIPYIPNAGTVDPQIVAENAGYGRSLNKDWNLVKNDPVGLDFRGALDYYDSWEIGSTRLNNLSSVFYTREYKTIKQDFQIGPETNEDVYYTDSIFSRAARAGAMQNFMLKINDNHQLHFDNFFNQLGQDQTMLRMGREPQSFSPSDSVLQIQYLWQERSLYTGQLGGKHSFGKNSHSVAWGGGYAYTSENIPNARRYEIRFTPGDLEGINNLVATTERGAEGFEFNLQNYQKTKEQAYSYFTDTEWRLANNIRLKAGVLAEFKTRNFDNRFITIRPGPQFQQQDGTLTLKGPERQYHVSEIFGNNFRVDGTGFTILDETNEGSAYNATQDYYAGYMGVSFPIFSDHLKVYGGVRYEWNRLVLNNEKFANLASPDVDQLTHFWLPSLNVTWSLNNKTLIRGAYGKSLNRPQFRELSAFRSFDLDEGYLQGNSNLETAEIQNVDLRWEYYPGEGQWLAAGLFYKEFKNPIEYISETQDNSLRASTILRNITGAKAYGAELEIRRKLDFVPVSLFEKLSVIINAAYLKNVADLRANDIVYAGSDLRDSERPLQGTSPFLINTALYYDNDKSGTLISVQHNIFGQRLMLAASRRYSDIFEMPRHSLDINIRQRLLKNLEMQAGIKNLLDQPFRYYRDFYRDGKYDPNKVAGEIEMSEGGNIKPGADYYHRYWKEGKYISVGIQYIIK